MSALLFRLAYAIWRTDGSFRQYPYGPPRRTLAHKFAWWAYHVALRMNEPTNGRISRKAFTIGAVILFIAWVGAWIGGNMGWWGQ